MASKQGILTDWPWKSLGSFKVYIQLLNVLSTTIFSTLATILTTILPLSPSQFPVSIYLYVHIITIIIINLIYRLHIYKYIYSFICRAAKVWLYVNVVEINGMAAIVHPFAEHVVYALLFAIPLLVTVLTCTASLTSLSSYVLYVDFMNNLGHCNFELLPKSFFSYIPPLKYLIYTPSWVHIYIHV